MKSRFGVKRPVLALAALAITLVVTGLTPASAIGHNNLSSPGTTGKIRVRSIYQDRTGATYLQSGDRNDKATNPNRTVGDVPDVRPNTTSSPCRLVTTDCMRILGFNDVSVNPSAADGHTHYHVGDTFLIVNDVAGFRAGDTVLIGSPHCNYAFLQLTCKRFATGFGVINEQPKGEVATIVGGDVAIDDSGPGVVEISSGLTIEQLEGTQIAKLPTLYQGQQMRIDVNHEDLLNCSLAPPLGCNPNSVAVTAKFIPPQGSHNASFPRRPLTLSHETQATSAVLAATCGIAGGCGGGFFSFYIPKEITNTATIGKSFSQDTPDTWYTVIIEAKDTVTGAIVADGVSRFKLNPAAILELKAKNPRDLSPATTTGEFFPTESVEITGKVRDNSAASSLTRPVEDVIVEVTVTNPGGGEKNYRVTSCVDTAPPGAPDQCGGNLFGSQPNAHGMFYVEYGGPNGCYLNPFGPNDVTCNGGAIGGPLDILFGMLDTFDTGTYDVLASLAKYAPPVTASTTFEVNIFGL